MNSNKCPNCNHEIYAEQTAYIIYDVDKNGKLIDNENTRTDYTDEVKFHCWNCGEIED